MALSPGTRLGTYEIADLIGEGGMGQVYRGRDIRLDRPVALKILPESFADDPERLARFEREAKTLASLNHPNIAIVHGFEEAQGIHALVMEYIEGPTLAERIARGPMPLDEALPVARQIAGALEAAHDQGIIHRDLKPANIKVRPDGTVRVLDFGLAKALMPEGSVAGSVANSPTITTPAGVTGAGVLLGTAAYMSPEQAKGRPADKRSDVWALGCVLFEMLTGQRAFQAEDVSDTLAAVLRGEPEWRLLPAATPPGVRRLLRRALQKDRSRRLQAAGDARIEIEEALSEPEASGAPGDAASKRQRRLAYAWATLALVFLATTLGLMVRRGPEPTPVAPPVRFDVLPPEGAVPNGRPVLSPDGRQVAFVATAQSRPQVWIRSMDAATSRPIPGTEDAEPFLFWSPDSRSIGFFAAGRLKRVAPGGGPSQVLAALPNDEFHTGAWNADAVILIGSQASGLRRVPATGGELSAVTELAPGELGHRVFDFLPDGQHYIFAAVAINPQAYIGVLGSSERTPLPGITSEVRYSPSGHLVFQRDGALVAQAFDAERLEVTGEPVVVAELPGGTRAGVYSLSATGHLAYRVALSAGDSRFAWFDRTGKQLALVGPPGEYVQPDLSPDGRFVAFQRGNQPDIWVLDLERGVTSPVTSDPGRDTSATWSPDGKTIAFDATRTGVSGLYERAFGVVGDDRLLLKSDVVRNLSDWSRDGRYLVFESGHDVAALPLPPSSDSQVIRVTDTPFTESSPKVSPDGRWVAYESDESRGQVDVFIQSFPQPGAKIQVSTNGGRQPQWRRDSRELYYMAPDLTLMAVTVKPAGASLELSAPGPLFHARSSGNRSDYWVSADGRFLLNLSVSEQLGAHFTIILNWASGLAK